jgi:AcrR family transcriptional regulator
MAITKLGVVNEDRRGRGRPQARPDEETRIVIVEAAREEFATSGYAATSMESVARRAGVSTKTLYRLIPNKAALFEANITDSLDRLVSRITLRKCDGDIEAAVREALIACGELILDGTVIGILRMVIGEGEKFPELTDTFYNKAIKRTESTLANWLKAHAERGMIEIDDATEAAGILLGMLAFQPQRAVMLGHKPAPSRKELERRAGVVAKLFLKGCASGQA